jgi:uncharacterized protein YdeI (YjbR/CyaY-like superfamily)
MPPTFFATPAEFRAWLEANHETAEELTVGFYKKGTGLPSLTWPESVDEALCVGWIDGLRKRIDDASYQIRFTPRKPTSTWSAVNIRRVEELQAEGRMRPAGLKAYELRRENRSGIYAYEQRPVELPEVYAEQMQQNEAAWNHFQAQPPWYRKTATWWIVSAKKEETRQKRLETLIRCSAEERPLPQLDRTPKK